MCSSEDEKELSSKLLEDDPIALKAWVQRYIQEHLEDPEVLLNPSRHPFNLLLWRLIAGLEEY